MDDILKDIDLEKASIKSDVYIDKKTSLPLKITENIHDRIFIGITAEHMYEEIMEKI